jgi:ribonuclease BN (tRNA processing enzyme)
MRLTVLGGCGAWPTASEACSGYLVEHEGFRLLVDPGYAVFPRLLRYGTAEAVDAVLVSHGHPDHCADLHPLLRARALSDAPPAPLPLHAPHGALDAVLALDRPDMLASAYRRHDFTPGDRFEVGPFTVSTRLLPHHVPNAGLRIATPDAVLVHTGDTGPGDAVPRLADSADVFLCEATYVHRVPEADAPYLLTADLAGHYAAQAGVARLLLTHLWPGTDPSLSHAAAAERFTGPLTVASPDLTLDVGTAAGGHGPRGPA